MGLLLSAIGATIAAVLDASLAPHLTIGNAVPHLVLVLGVIWSIAAGIERGVAWAFVGGLVLDSLLGRPLGATAFSMLVAVGGARVVVQALARLRLLTPIIAVPLLSLVYSFLTVLLTASAPASATLGDPFGSFAPSALYDGALGILFGPLIVSAYDRQIVVERVTW